MQTLNISLLTLLLACLNISPTSTEHVSQRAVTITISDVELLKEDLEINGFNSKAVDVIVSAASCRLPESKRIEDKLDSLISPMTRMHAAVERMLNLISTNGKQRQLSRNEGVLELVVEHRINGAAGRSDTKELLMISNEEETISVPMNSPLSMFNAMMTTEVEISPELCLSYDALKEMIDAIVDRKRTILRIMKKVYGYSNGDSITEIAKFYINRVSRVAGSEMWSMGLVKAMGEYASISSEAYFLSVAFEKMRSSCGSVDLKRNILRKRRNVPVNAISIGQCIRVNNVTKSEDFKELGVAEEISDTINVELVGKNDVSCIENSKYVEMIINNEYRGAIVARFLGGNSVCVYLAMCPKDWVIAGSIDSCMKLPGAKKVFKSVDDLSVSLVRNRMKVDEIPIELVSLEKKYCTIAGVVLHTDSECRQPIKTMEKFSLIQIGDEWRMTDKSVLVSHGQDPSSLCFYNCTRGCKDCSKCDGDESYVANFGLWPKSDCYCKYCHNCSDLYAKIGDSSMSINAYATQTWKVSVPALQKTVGHCSSCKVKCVGSKVHIEKDEAFKTIHLCVENNCRSFHGDSNDFSKDIPADLIHALDIEIRLYKDDSEGFVSMRTTCSDKHVCASVTCDICLLRFSNPHCYKFVNWIIIIFAVIASLITLPLIYLLIKSIWLIVKVMLLPVKFCLKLSTKGSKIMINKVSEKSIEAKERIERFVDEKESTPVKRSFRFSNTNAIVLVSLFFVLMNPVLCCENTIAVDSKALECSKVERGIMKCSVNTVIDVPLSVVGEEACVTLSDQSGTIVHNIKIRTMSIMQKCNKNILYYTMEPNFKLLNTFRCREAGSCTGDNCESQKVDGIVPVPGIQEGKAGLSGCKRVTGFWGKTCFYASQACQFYKAELQNPSKKVYEVSKCSEWYWEIIMEIKSEDHSGVRVENKTLDSALPIRSLIGQVQLQSLSVPLMSGTDECLIRSLSGTKKSALASCTSRNLHVVGLIGDIQCATPNLAEAASKSCYIGESSIIISPQDDNIIMTVRSKNVTDAWLDGLLPRNLSSSVLTEDVNGQVSLHYNSKALYNLRIRTDNYKISYEVIKAKCESHFRSLSGCANCGAGASLVVEVTVSGSLRGIASAHCPSALSNVSQLVTTASPRQTFRMAFTISEVDEDCIITCPANTNKIRVKGSLLSAIKLYDHGLPSLLGKGADFFSSIPWANFGALRYFYLVSGTILLIPVLYLLCKAIILLIGLCIWRRPKSKTQSKYN
uniref:Glycoprotein n=1 Tax=Niwlog virus TaxID=2800933 RepID=A0A894KLE9_9VIRU|nr:MAG: glycoprotein [Niwlog virus]